jgi:hypothetical protein
MVFVISTPNPLKEVQWHWYNTIEINTGESGNNHISNPASKSNITHIFELKYYPSSGIIIAHWRKNLNNFTLSGLARNA